MSKERKRDLAARERVNFVLSNKVITLLREKSAKDGVPMSRIIDAAVAAYLEPSGAPVKGSAKNGITLYHSLEMRLEMPYGAAQTGALVSAFRKFFPNSAVTPCLYPKESGEQSVVGAKIETYFSDEQGDAFAACIAALGARPERANIRLLRDTQPIDLF